MTKSMCIQLISVGFRIYYFRWGPLYEDLFQQLELPQTWEREKVPVNVNKFKGCMCREKGEIGKGGDSFFLHEPPLGPSPNTLSGLEVNEGWVGWGQDPPNVYTAVCYAGSIFFLLCPQNFKSPQLWFSLHPFYLVLVSCVSPGLRLWTRHCGISVLFKIYH